MDKQVSDDETDHYEKTSDNNPTNLNPGAGGFYESADHAINESFQFRLAATLPKSGRYVDYDEYKDSSGKKGLRGQQQRLTQYVKQIYKVLMSRGRFGCYVYCRDENLKQYLKSRLSVI